MRRTAIYLLTSAICLLPSAVCMADTITLDLSRILPAYPQTENGFWEDTYVPGVIEDSLFRFAHTGSSDGGGGMAYWEGFTLCTSGDTTNYGAEGSSDGWILNQWGCMAGGGADGQGGAVQGAPYLVGYWGFFQEQQEPDYHSLRIDFTDNQAHRPLGVWICNHPWPYYGNINGDGFASAFTEEGDYFALVTHGLDASGAPTGSTARLILALYQDSALHQSRNWEYMDLSSLGAVNGLYFTMETSDMDALYGANTAVYFCMDLLTVLGTQAEELTRPTNLQIRSAGEDSLTLSWAAVRNAESYRLWIDSTYAGNTTDTCFTFRSLQSYTQYTLSVAAVNATDTSDVASITAQTTDETAPSVPQGLEATPSRNSIVLSWQPAEDNAGIKRYTAYLDGQAYKRTTTCTCAFQGLEPNTEYLLEVEAEDQAGNKSDKATLRVSTLNTALELIDASDPSEPQEVYTLDGRFVGHTVPRTGGPFIVKKKQKTMIFIN